MSAGGVGLACSTGSTIGTAARLLSIEISVLEVSPRRRICVMTLHAGITLSRYERSSRTALTRSSKMSLPFCFASALIAFHIACRASSASSTGAFFRPAPALPPPLLPLTCKDSPPSPASSSDVRANAPSGCTRVLVDHARRVLTGARSGGVESRGPRPEW